MHQLTHLAYQPGVIATSSRYATFYTCPRINPEFNLEPDENFKINFGEGIGNCRIKPLDQPPFAQNELASRINVFPLGNHY